MGKVTETKCTCKACGDVYYYGKKELWQNFSTELGNVGAEMDNLSKGALCCSGCAPAILIPDKKRQKTIDLGKCPKCGSRAIKKEQITHDV